MKQLFSYLTDPRPDTRGVVFAFVIVCLFGAGLSFLVVNRLGGGDSILRPLGGYDYWAIFSGGCGAGAGLYTGRRWLGGTGLQGLINAVVSIPIISFIGALYAGTMALPIYGTMFGPMALAVTFYENQIVLGFWIWTVLIAHILVASYRRSLTSQEASPDQSLSRKLRLSLI